jgi:hypothetical protein
MKFLITIILFLSTPYLWGQGKANKELLQFLKANKLDTFLVVKNGCPNCSISYEDSIKPVDTAIIWLLYKKHGQQNLIKFSDISKTERHINIESNILKFIKENRHVLKLKDTYYQEQKHLKFQAPCLAIFPYEKMQIQVGQFKYKHTLVKRETDDCGTVLTNEKWFKIELEILKKFDLIKNIE